MGFFHVTQVTVDVGYDRAPQFRPIALVHVVWSAPPTDVTGNIPVITRDVLNLLAEVVLEVHSLHSPGGHFAGLPVIPG